MIDRRPHPIRWLQAHPIAADWILACVFTVMAVVFHLADFENDDADFIDPSWWTVVLAIGSVLPIAWRRTHTIGATITVVLFQVTAAFLDVDATGFFGVVIALYSLGAHTSGRPRFRVVLFVQFLILILFIAGLIVGELNISDFIASTIVLVTSFVLGDNVRRRRDSALAVLERAERAERERELIAQREVNAERSRIARELHDVVAHSVSVMVIQAAAARRSLSTSPDNAEQALSNIEDTGRQTMNELRGILGVLRRSTTVAGGGVEEEIDGPDRGPQPGLGDLRLLVDQSDDLPIAMQVTGDIDDLPDSIALTGFRVVQEALTNIRRHAGAVNSVVVTIERVDEAVGITVVDDGRGAAADDQEPGFGIIGMRERVAAIGGTIAVGWNAGGGWRVAVTLPIDRRTSQPVSPPSTEPSERETIG